MGISKSEFQSTETPQISVEPFINPSLTGSAARITTGDTVTCTYYAPNASTGTVSMTRNATTKIWTGSLGASFQAGLWLFVLTSDDASGPDIQYRAIYWGVGAVEDVLTIKTRLGIPTGATFSADLAEIEAETDDIAAVKAKTDLIPASPASTSDVTSARDSIKGSGLPDIAAVKAKTDLIPASPASTSDVTSAISSIKGSGSPDIASVITAIGSPEGGSLAAAILVLRKFLKNNWDIIPPGTLRIYDDNNSSIFQDYDILDANDQPTTTRVRKRHKV